MHMETETLNMFMGNKKKKITQGKTTGGETVRQNSPCKTDMLRDLSKSSSVHNKPLLT